MNYASQFGSSHSSIDELGNPDDTVESILSGNLFLETGTGAVEDGTYRQVWNTLAKGEGSSRPIRVVPLFVVMDGCWRLKGRLLKAYAATEDQPARADW